MTRRKRVWATQPQPFNERAHPIVADVIDAAERWLIRNGVCEPQQTDEYLTMAYVKECGQFLEHGCYTENEGRIAADLYLSRLSNAGTKALKERYHRNYDLCALHLHWHTPYYFPDYHRILRMTYIHLLRTLEGLDEIDRNGVLKLAARNLPGVRTDINRERRRRGATKDRILIADGELSRSMAHFYGDKLIELKMIINTTKT